MFTRHHSLNCLGLVLWSGRRYHVELWYLRSDSDVPYHRHYNHNSTIVVLFGHNAELWKTMAGRKGEYDMIFKWWQRRRIFSIPYNVFHSAITHRTPLIFLTITSSCLVDVKGKPAFRPTSASNDIELWKR